MRAERIDRHRWRASAPRIVLAICLCVSANANAQSVSYSYDVLNRLTRVVLTDGTTITYTYDAAGNRTNRKACSFVLSATSETFTAAGGEGSVDVVTMEACDWTAISNDAFISLTDGAAGSGPGSVTFEVAPNGTGAGREGTLSIAGRTYVVTQSAALAPEITMHPSDTTVTSGSMATFSVAASGVPAPSYQWQVFVGDGAYVDLAEAAPYSNVTTATLTIAASAALNGKQYRAVATNTAAPPATSNAATLTVTFAPAITTHPWDATVTTGLNATFTVAASGNPAPTYRWQIANGAGTFRDLAEAAPYSNVTTATLTITASPALNGARYRAIATNAIAPPAASNVATLSVVLPPGPDAWTDAIHGDDANAGTSSSPFRTIRRALTAVGADGTVHVRPGTYNTSLGETFPITVPSGIRLQSTDGAGSTIIDADGANTRVLHCTANRDTTLIEGFTITGGLVVQAGGGSAHGGAILTENDDRTTISRCIVSGNEVRGHSESGGAAYGGGISIDGRTMLTNCVVSNNIARGGNGGSAHGGGVWASGEPRITNCTFNANQTIGGDGGSAWYAVDSAGATIVNSIISNNVVAGGSPTEGGVHAAEGANNLFFNNMAGDGFVGTAALTDTDPLYANPPGDLHLLWSSPARQAGTSADAPVVDLDGRPRPTPPAIGAYDIGLFPLATGGIGRITVTWPQVPGAASYTLYMAQSADVTTSSTHVGGVTSPYVLFPLANDTRRYFRVSAVFNGTEGPLSPVVSASTSSGSWVRGALANGGSNFTNLTRDLGEDAALYATAADSVGLYKSIDNGDTWTAVSGPFSGHSMSAVAAADSTVLVAGDGAIYRSADGGTTWSAVVTGAGAGEETGLSLAIDPMMHTDVYAGNIHIDGGSTSTDLLARSVDGGLSFSNLTDVTARDLRARFLQIDSVTSGTLYAAGSGTPNVAVSTNNGNTWTAVSPRSGHATALVLGPASTLFTAMVDPDMTKLGIFKTTNGGATWTPASSGLPDVLPGVDALWIESSSANRVHAGTSQGHYVSVDGGSTWTRGAAGGGGLRLNALAQTSARRLIGTAANGIWLLPLDSGPVVTSVEPAFGGAAGGTAVTVTGSGFSIASGLRVLFGATDGTIDFGSSSSGSINVTSPAHPAGTIDVAVVNPDGQSAIRTGAFTFSDCAASIAPTFANQDSSPGTGTIRVTAESDCAWTATAPSGSFVSITSGASGNGDGEVTYAVTANATASARSATLTIGGTSFQIDQSASGVGTMILSATASPESVALAWTGLGAATSYEVRRSNDGAAFQLIATTGAPAYVDGTISNRTGYLYQIVGIASGGAIGFSNVDLAVPFDYTVPAVVAGGWIRADDFSELRLAVNAARAAVGLPACSFTDSLVAGVTIRAVHATELRACVDTVRTVVGLSKLNHAEPIAAATVIRAAHIVDLREGLK